MPKTASVTDKFANIAYLKVTESSAATLTFAQLQLANNLISEKAALILNRAEFMVSGLASLNSTGDYVDIALTVSDRVTPLDDLSQPEILFHQAVERVDHGTAATSHLVEWPFTRDFNSLPGGGILVPADRLYLGIKGTGTTPAISAIMRLYYTVISLTTDDYWELIQARRVMTT